jgi:hypothetical protein
LSRLRRLHRWLRSRPRPSRIPLTAKHTGTTCRLRWPRALRSAGGCRGRDRGDAGRGRRVVTGRPGRRSRLTRRRATPCGAGRKILREDLARPVHNPGFRGLAVGGL